MALAMWCLGFFSSRSRHTILQGAWEFRRVLFRSTTLRAEQCLRHPCLYERSIPTGRKGLDRKSTRLNSSHLVISSDVFCLKKKTGNSKLTHNIARLAHSARLHHVTATL